MKHQKKKSVNPKVNTDNFIDFKLKHYYTLPGYF